MEPGKVYVLIIREIRGKSKEWIQDNLICLRSSGFRKCRRWVIAIIFLSPLNDTIMLLIIVCNQIELCQPALNSTLARPTITLCGVVGCILMALRSVINLHTSIILESAAWLDGHRI